MSESPGGAPPSTMSYDGRLGRVGFWASQLLLTTITSVLSCFNVEERDTGSLRVTGCDLTSEDLWSRSPAISPVPTGRFQRLVLGARKVHDRNVSNSAENEP